MRNPWGFTFDRGGSHELIAADMGQDRWEEINLIVKGGNYGWRLREGFDDFDPKNPRNAPAEVPRTGADGKPLIDPVLVYKTWRGNRDDPESFGSCINGGYVHRGKAIPQLAGKYVFGDWSRNLSFPDGTLLVATRPEKPGSAERWTAQRLSGRTTRANFMFSPPGPTWSRERVRRFSSSFRSEQVYDRSAGAIESGSWWPDGLESMRCLSLRRRPAPRF